MATDWNTPSLTQLWANFLASIKGRDESAAKLDFTGDTNLPTGAVRYNRTSNRFEEWNGTAWVALTPDLTSTTGILPAGQFTDTAHGSRSGGTLHSAASGAAAGFMAAADKTKLDGATNLATANTLMQRDTNGRSTVAVPLASDDIARKDTVDGHAVATSGVHGVGASAVESTSGAQGKVDTHAAQTAAGTHGATAAPISNSVMFRDANARVKVAAPAAADDVARKQEVDNAWVDPMFTGANTGAQFTKGFAVDPSLSGSWPNYPARIKQQVNGQFGLELVRQTDTAPTGSLLRMLNAAYTALLAEITATGTVRSPGFYTNGDASYLRDDGLVVPNAANLTGVTFSAGRITSASVGTAALRTAPGSAAIQGDTLQVTMNYLSFFPSLTDQSVGVSSGFGTNGNVAVSSVEMADPGNDGIGRIRIHEENNFWPCVLRWFYMTASDEPAIWVGYEPASWSIQASWTADDPPFTMVDEFVDDPQEGLVLRKVRKMLSQPPIKSPTLAVVPVPLSTLIQLALPPRVLDAADRHIEREKLKPENRLYRALQFHARDVAPARWLLENCAWDPQGGVIREFMASEKVTKRAARGTAGQ